MDNIFVKRLNETLKLNKMSQNELARRIGMSQSVVNNYCTGKHQPPIDILILICKELNESADYLIGLID